MTEQEAYKIGFCKTAEDMGVNPEALVKAAGIGQLGKRFLQLLKGGKMTRYHELQKLNRMGVDEGIFRYGKRKLKDYIRALEGNLGNDTAKELKKVLAARLGTLGGIGGIGGIAGGAYALKSDK